MNETYYQPSEQFDALSAMLAALPDSPGVLRLGCEIPNYPSFFPGGRGYKGRSFPQAPIMLIGHNFDTEAGFRRSVARGSEDHLKMKTWVNMKESFLPTARLSEDECFFTNFYLGAIVHPAPKPGEGQKTKNTGTFKCTPQYRASCVKALRIQVEVVRPKVVALLGGNVSGPFAEAFPTYAPHCGVDLADTQMKQPAGGHALQLLQDLRVQVVCLAHPANPRSLESHRAQGLLLGAAVRASSVKEISLTAQGNS
jgi:hypothetical protein